MKLSVAVACTLSLAMLVTACGGSDPRGGAAAGVASSSPATVATGGTGTAGTTSPASPTDPAGTPAKSRPNILFILADDLGYSDLGAFGSEIATPNLDRLAREGHVLSNLHVTPLCATTRAELLTGVDHHLVGVGTLADSNFLYPGDAEYSGALNAGAPTLAQLLFDAGYHTFQAGKWHLGSGGPSQFGFEQSFSLNYSSGDAANYANTTARPEPDAQAHYENGVAVDVPDGFYSSDYYTDKLISYIDQTRADGKPFFGYLAFQAVHFPLQVPKAWIDPYQGRYDAGYEVIRNARIAKQKALGLIPQDFAPNPGDEVSMVRYGQPGVPTNMAWETLSASDKASEARIMEVFAGMLTNMDANIGRLIAELKKNGQYDNTLIVFLGDNGADGMGQSVPGYDQGRDAQGQGDNSLANYGLPGSFIYRSTRWAEVGSAPFRLFKGYTAEGGIASPTIVHLPRQTATRAVTAIASVLDLVPTALDAAGVAGPGTTYHGATVAPLEGTSLLPLLGGTRPQAHADAEVFADEVNDIRYVRRGPWKMTRVVNYAIPSTGYLLNQNWQLYQMTTDRGETTDVAAAHPDVVADLTAQWQAYVNRVGVEQPVFPPTTTPIDQ